MACDIVMDNGGTNRLGSSSQIIIDLLEVLKIFGGRYYLLYRKAAGGFSRNIQEEK